MKHLIKKQDDRITCALTKADVKGGVNCFFILVFITFQFILSAQTPKHNAVLSLKNDPSIAVIAPFDGKKKADLPLSISLRTYCPIPAEQGQTSACAAWATCFGALTICHTVLGNIDKNNINDKAFSAAFIYNAADAPLSIKPCEKPLSLPDALRYLQKKGTCLSSTFPNNSPCDQRPSAIAQAEAAAFRINDFEALFAETADSALKIRQLRSVLVDFQPIVVGMEITSSFYSVPKGQRHWTPAVKNEPTIGGHALVLIGFDQASQTFELMNSWGTDWADGGFVRIGYSDFLQHLRQAYRLILPKKRVEPLREAVFSIKNASHTEGGIEIKKSGKKDVNSYDIKTKVIDKTLFQIEAQLGTTAFVYVLMPDTEPFVCQVSAEKPFILPAKDEAFDIKSPLCLLVSVHPINDFDQRMKHLKEAKGTFFEQINTSFGDILINPREMSFDNNQISFKVKTPSLASVASFFLQIR